MALFRRKRRDEELDARALASEIATVERVLANYPPATRISFGAPTRCPTCADFGLVELVDTGGHAFNRCLRCASTWMLTERAIQAQREIRRPLPPLGAPLVLPATADAASRPELAIPPKTGLLFSRGTSGDVTKQVVQGTPEQPLPRSAPEPQLVPGRLSERKAPMRVLLVEDNPDDVEVVRAILQPAGPDVIDLRTARTRAAGEAVARSSRPDLVLLDLGLPDSRGINTVEQWYDHVNNAPVLVVSGDYGRDLVVGGRELGVAGILDKADLVRFLELGDAGTTAFLDQLSAAAAC